MHEIIIHQGDYIFVPDNIFGIELTSFNECRLTDNKRIADMFESTGWYKKNDTIITSFRCKFKRISSYEFILIDVYRSTYRLDNSLYIHNECGTSFKEVPLSLISSSINRLRKILFFEY